VPAFVVTQSLIKRTAASCNARSCSEGPAGAHQNLLVAPLDGAVTPATPMSFPMVGYDRPRRPRTPHLAPGRRSVPEALNASVRALSKAFGRPLCVLRRNRAFAPAITF
jgi:hypothetical protein